MTIRSPALPHDRLRIRVKGAVQGVGFRPFVYRLATRNGLSGFVLNDGDGVLAEIEGEALDVFLAAMLRTPPPLARIMSVDAGPVPARGQLGFDILPSLATAAQTRIGPDVATCCDCLDDLLDPASRFHLYPFVSCTHCGPRATITVRLPYDRANTSMAPFPLCNACSADYCDPSNRRFHAEGIACAACGPSYDLPVEAIAAALGGGQIVALKGIGGFHLLCDARNEMAIANLRRRKHRPDKPFAIMVADARSVAAIAAPTSAERAMLESSASPIVLIRSANRLPVSLAPGLGRLGVMLAHTPLDHLLFRALEATADAGQDAPQQRAPAVLVATSANVSGDPLIIDDDHAHVSLTGIADLIVTHNRQIVERMDDSVRAIIDGAPAYIRRARGAVPEPIDLGSDGADVIAVGAHLKATICVTRGREAYLSQHLGDLSTARTRRSYEEMARQMLSMLDVRPEAVACDLHPDYHSTHFAGTLGLPVVRVQHHAAHVAAVAAESQLTGPLIGVALDGHGIGDDGAAWGGELLLSDGPGWRRVGHLKPLPYPGGDRAAREPWRMGVAALTVLGRADEAAARFPDHRLADALTLLIAGDPKLATTSSLGRLFDAAAALLGLSGMQSYEGQTAMQLEACATQPRCMAGGFGIVDGVLDFRPLLAALLEPGLTLGEGADLFHGTLIAGLGAWIAQLADVTGCTQMILSGGCMMNAVLTAGLAANLRDRGLVPWLPRAAPANDGGLSLGQAVLARAYLSRKQLHQPELRI